MDKRFFIIDYRAMLGTAVFVAVIVQFLHSAQTIPGFNPVNFWSFFTIESNLLAASLFLITAVLLARGKHTERLAMLRGAATLFMTITGIIYVLLLAGLDVQTPVPWVNTVLHYIMPAVVLLDWLIDPPKKPISAKQALWWLIFPAAYLVYSLIRGHFTGWYPYPFLNPTDDGYAGVTVVSAVIAASALAIAMLLAWTTKRHPRRK